MNDNYKCLECGHVADYMEFVFDYRFDWDIDDEVAVLKCPKCGNEEWDDDEQFVEVEQDDKL